MKGIIALFIAWVVIGLVCVMGSTADAGGPYGPVFCSACKDICVMAGQAYSDGTNCSPDFCFCTGSPLMCSASL